MLLVADRKTSAVPVDGRILRKLRLDLPMSQRELADATGMSEPAIRGLETGRTQAMYAKNFRRMAVAFKMSIDEAKQVLAPQSALDNNIEPPKTFLAPIPTFDLAIAAGGFSDVSEVGEINADLQSDSIRQGLFRVRIRGDSMKPRYAEGDVVEFRLVHCANGELEVGRDYAVFIAGNEGTFKRLEAVERDHLILRPLNRRKYRKMMKVDRSLVVAMAVCEATVDPWKP